MLDTEIPRKLGMTAPTEIPRRLGMTNSAVAEPRIAVLTWIGVVERAADV